MSEMNDKIVQTCCNCGYEWIDDNSAKCKKCRVKPSIIMRTKIGKYHLKVPTRKGE